MITKLLIATNNQAKFKEIALLLKQYDFELLSLNDLGIKTSVEETGKTFDENSKLKAAYYGQLAQLPTLADDGGLEIEALNGWPGVYSRRIFGPNKPEASDDEIITEVLRRMENVPEDKRGCRFSVIMSLFIPPSTIYSEAGYAPGIIPIKPGPVRLHNLPFRTVFFLPNIDKTVAELSAEDQANFMNHRKKAIIKLEPYLKQLANYA